MARKASDYPTIRKTGPTLKVLSVMFDNGANQEYHGYELAKQLRSHQSAYAIFRKLEGHGLVVSRWEDVDGRRRRYYKLTGRGIDYCLHIFSDGSNSIPRLEPT